MIAIKQKAFGRIAPLAAVVVLCSLAFVPAVEAQTYGTRLGTVKRGCKVSFEPSGPGVLFDALDPAVRKWFIPQELYNNGSDIF